MASLQQNIINFTQRLHSAEVERRSLRMERNKLKDENCQLKRKTEHAENVDKELTRLRQEVCMHWDCFSRVLLNFLPKGRWKHFQGYRNTVVGWKIGKTFWSQNCLAERSLSSFSYHEPFLYIQSFPLLNKRMIWKTLYQQDLRFKTLLHIENTAKK